ncbi:MAG TPA: hypothetical protein ENI81_07085 [Phycisphaerales bacterium]|nr:hypothetical protein [Phycisphaerales bacterium]
MISSNNTSQRSRLTGAGRWSLAGGSLVLGRWSLVGGRWAVAGSGTESAVNSWETGPVFKH